MGRVANKSGTAIVLRQVRGDGGRYSYGEITLKEDETAKLDGGELRNKYRLTKEVSAWKVYRLENSKPGMDMGVVLPPYQLTSGKTMHIKKVPDEDRWFAEEETLTQNWLCPFFS